MEKWKYIFEKIYFILFQATSHKLRKMTFFLWYFI